MNPTTSRRSSRSAAFFILLTLFLISALGVVASTASVVELGDAVATTGLSDEETAYYEYVAPRLDRLVTEVDDVVVMVEGKSRDILALTISGSRIEALSDEIVRYGEEHGVPERFEDVHASILQATETATYTFDQARESLRTFNFSRMTGLVEDFRNAANGLRDADAAMSAIAGTAEGS